MPRSPLIDPSEASDEPLSSESFHELPPELDDEEFDAVDVPTGDEPLRSARVPRRKLLLAGAVVAVLTLLAGGLLGYRTHHRRAVLQDGLARADTLLRLDTAAGYRGAATLLEPLAQLDPLDAGGARAFALAMLATDYRDASAGRTAELLLVEPMRADEVPPRASLAAAALALGRREAGDAMTAAVRAGALPEARVISGRIALLAGNIAAAVEPVQSAAEAGAPAALALRGDILRRTRRDLGAARASYGAALSASPMHPRAAFGLAKLALAGHATDGEAATALRRVLEDRERTPGPERGRAALHLAALRLRAGDRAGADAALDAAALDASSRSWAERAAAVEAAQRGPYRAVEGAPAGIRSASDDDPPVLPAVAPAPPPPPPAVAPARPAPKPSAKAPAAKAKTATAKRPAVKPAAKAKAAAAKKKSGAAPAKRAKSAAPVKRPTSRTASTRR
ncbi:MULTISPECIES: hypothetical protein [Anaeromyxobacter]|uniref:hypothetical protein n=1 Tax=Anaeromyxobacter TaxID=161492 RepID=UPI001F574A8E|nr:MULTISPECIES: hypothetical protein [unclassified Anaeromyxobacter]